MRRRRANAILAGLAISPLVGCGGGSSDNTTTSPTPASSPGPASAPSPASTPETPAATTKQLKVAYEPTRDISTAWTDDGSVIAVGNGDFRSPGVVAWHGQLSNASDKLEYTVDSPTQCSYYSSDNTVRIVVDRTNPALVTVRLYRNGVFESGWAFYSQGDQTYVGTFATDGTPSISDLKDVRVVTIQQPATASKRAGLLASFLDMLVPAARANEVTDRVDAFINSAVPLVLSTVPYIAGFIAAFGCAELGPAGSAFCAVGAWGITSAIFTPLLANAADAPPHVYPKSEPPSGTIPYGTVVYVDDGVCPAGQIKQLIGGNNDLGIPRRRACVPMPATIP